MPEFTWNEKQFGVGVVLMDAHHRELFAIMRDLHAAMREGRGREAVAGCMKRLVAYVDFHFTEEEILLARHAYPALAEQQRAHAEFKARVAGMQQPEFAAGDTPALDLLVLLRDWLMQHIAVQDRAYTDYLHARGVR